MGKENIEFVEQQSSNLEHATWVQCVLLAEIADRLVEIGAVLEKMDEHK